MVDRSRFQQPIQLEKHDLDQPGGHNAFRPPMTIHDSVLDVNHAPKKPEPRSQAVSGWELENPSSYRKDMVYVPVRTRDGSQVMGVVWPAYALAETEILIRNGRCPGIEGFADMALDAAYHSLHYLLGESHPDLRAIRLDAEISAHERERLALQGAVSSLVIPVRYLVDLGTALARVRMEDVLVQVLKKVAAIGSEYYRRAFVEELGRELDMKRLVERLFREASEGVEPITTSWVEEKPGGGSFDPWALETGKEYDVSKFYIATGKGSEFGEPANKPIRCPVGLKAQINQLLKSGQFKSLKTYGHFFRNAVAHRIHFYKENDITVGSSLYQFRSLEEGYSTEVNHMEIVGHVRIGAISAVNAHERGDDEGARRLAANISVEVEGIEDPFWREVCREKLSERLMGTMLY